MKIKNWISLFTWFSAYFLILGVLGVTLGDELLISQNEICKSLLLSLPPFDYGIYSFFILFLFLVTNIAGLPIFVFVRWFIRKYYSEREDKGNDYIINFLIITSPIYLVALLTQWYMIILTSQSGECNTIQLWNDWFDIISL